MTKYVRTERDTGSPPQPAHQVVDRRVRHRVTQRAAPQVDEHVVGVQRTVLNDVTEGSGGIWERLHYDWSDPNDVVLTTTDSNVWGGHSRHTYTFIRQPFDRGKIAQKPLDRFDRTMLVIEHRP